MAALAAALLLAGCSISGSGGGSTGGGTDGGGTSGQTGGGVESGESTIESTTSPGDIDLGQFEGLPNTFPTDEVPLIDEPVDMGIDLGTGWSVMMTVDDYQAAFEDAASRLSGAGFEVITQTVSDAGGVGVFQNPKYQVQLTASDSPDNGPNLTYVVILRG